MKVLFHVKFDDFLRELFGASAYFRACAPLLEEDREVKKLA